VRDGDTMADMRATFGGRPAIWITVAVASVAVAVAIGLLSARSIDLALPIALVVLIVGLSSVDLRVLPFLAVPATLAMARVAGFVSISDVVLAGAAIVALLLVRGKISSGIRPLIWSGSIYLALAVPTLILNPYAENVVEWVHEFVLVLGSLIVGFALGRTGAARAALTCYVLLCCAIGVVAAVVALRSFVITGHFDPVYLPNLHKNLIGGALATAGIIAFARPVWLEWGRTSGYLALALCSIGIAAAQSRQGLIALLVGMFVVSLRPRPDTGRRPLLTWLLTVPIAAYVISEVALQLSSTDQHNSLNQRLDWFSQSFDVWRDSPLFGVGMRWWYTDRYPVTFQPPNAELEVLTTTGVVGLAGFLIMFAGIVWQLWRMDPVYGTVGLAVVLARFAQAQFDLYWVAGQASLLWIVAGICVGVQALDKEKGVVRSAPGLNHDHRASTSLPT
jgi:O-antigen ligase